MNPWLVFFAPQLHLPFGGNLAQRIEPNTNWFFDAISPTAGDANIERKAFDVASYGRQLGLITEVLVDITAEAPPSTAEGKKSLKRLIEIKTEIDRLKERDASAVVQEVEALIDHLKRKHEDLFPHLKTRIERSLVLG
jgi:hypothetical protein